MVPDPDLKIPSAGLKIKDRYIRIRIQKLSLISTPKNLITIFGGLIRNKKNRARLMARTIG